MTPCRSVPEEAAAGAAEELLPLAIAAWRCCSTGERSPEGRMYSPRCCSIGGAHELNTTNKIDRASCS